MLSLSRWSGQFIDPVVEFTFRAENVIDERKQARASVTALAGLYVLFLVSDLQRFGLNAVEMLVRAPLRLIVGLAAVWVVRQLGRAQNTVVQDRLVGGFGLLVLASFVAVNTLTYRPTLILGVSMFLLTICAFIALPTAFAWNAALGVACVSSFTILLMSKHDASGVAIPIMLLGMATACALLLRQMNALRRRAWWALCNEREARAGLAEASESVRKIFVAVPVPFALVSISSGRLLQANDLAIAALQLVPEDMGFLRLAELLARNEDKQLLRELTRRSNAMDRHEVKILRRDGTDVDALVSATHVDHKGESCLLFGFTDISDIKRLERELYQQASFDALTGLANRRTFMTHLHREFANTRRQRGRLSLLFMDIDYFKRVNDTHGHAAGDEVLRMFAQTITLQVRAGDLCARIGGEEFVVLLPATDFLEAGKAAERIRAAVAARPMQIGTATFHCTVSVGCATLTEYDADADALIAAADGAAYAAKEAGRNRVVHARGPDSVEL